MPIRFKIYLLMLFLLISLHALTSFVLRSRRAIQKEGRTCIRPYRCDSGGAPSAHDLRVNLLDYSVK